MKRLLTMSLVFVMAAYAAVSANAGYDPEIDYMEEMIQAAAENNWAVGLAAEQCRNEQIYEMGLDEQPIGFEDLCLLAKIMYAEAGSVWLSDEWKMAVGEVVLNRVESVEFPDTIREVLWQKGQYYDGNSYFRQLKPSERCVRLALRVLEGERVMNDKSVVFQANFKQGSGVCLALYDSTLGWTYMCYSSRPELYEQAEDSGTQPESAEEETAAQEDEVTQLDTYRISRFYPELKALSFKLSVEVEHIALPMQVRL